MNSLLQQNIKYLKGVGPQRAKVLGEDAEIQSLQDLLYYFPYKYIDRTVVHRICDLQEDMPYVQLRGQILDFFAEGAGRKKRIRATFTDGTGVVEIVWFAGLRYVENTYKVNRPYLLFGKPSIFNGHFSFSHPELENGDEQSLSRRAATLQPLYRTSEKMKRIGLTSRAIAELVRSAFALVPTFDETLPPYLIQDEGLMPLGEALRTAHFPKSADVLPAALHRLKFEELFYLQLEILRYANRRKRSFGGFRFERVGEHFLTFFHQHLPFELTGAQKRVVREIRNDTRSGRQMNRLLQGDVGSGKTMVALLCSLLAIDNGFQACIMAPTEILAEQHFASLSALLADMPLRVELLTGIVKGKRRREVLAGIESGNVALLVGTHALIEPTVRFRNLGLAIIDEQHRFGVKQRAMLWQKNTTPPHVLVMTATPIPRTLAMTVYGDLDVSVIDELPPGRKPIRTVHYYDDQRAKLFAGVAQQLALGRQIYFVFPLIKESEALDVQFVEQGFKDISAAFPAHVVTMVHGQMAPSDKEAEMQRFVRGEAHILVSTTVIEVGVNVPNAGVMVIWNAERFGLAQLHQLRGRVGRGADQSYCVLLTKRALSEDARKKIRVMTETNDGFRIAEEDMRLRGPGDLEGTQQSGMPFDLRVANILRDNALLAHARGVAEHVLEADPAETLPQNAVLWSRLRGLRRQKQNYSEIS